MKTKLDWQKRALILFAALILILSVILTVFAIREAEREKLLKQREVNEEQQRVAALIIDQVKEHISETEQRILMLLGQSKDRSDEDRLIDAAIRMDENEPLVSEVFYVGVSRRVSFPLSKPLYILSGESEYSKEIPNDIEGNPLFKAAEDAEFKTKNYSLAIRNYSQLMTSTSDKTADALLLNRMGRCYLNSGNPLRAVDIYKRIVSSYEKEVGPDGIPFALIALYQIGSVYARMDKKPESVEAFLKLYEGLLESEWFLSRTQFYFYLKKIKGELARVIAEIEDEETKNVFAEKQTVLRHVEEERLKRMGTLEEFHQRILPVLMTRQKAVLGVPESFSHFSDTTGEKTHLVSYNSDEKNSIFGFTLDEEYLTKGLIPSVMEKILFNESWNVQVVDDKQNLVYRKDISQSISNGLPMTYSRDFEENFPPWAVRIYQTAPNTAQKEFNLRRNIYISLAAVVIAALLFGGVLAIKSTAKELKLAKLKSEFVATVSHEFRTPLTSIRYLADLLQRGRVGKEERKQKYYESITHESERLSRLIENILDFSKIEAGMKEYEFEETDVAEMCGDVVSRFQEQADPQEFTIESDIPDEMPNILADKEALPRALFNLLDNAVKYSGDCRQIQFRTWAEQNHIFFKVKDQGIGIPRDDQDKVFEKFYRAGDIPNSTIKGSGIGLTIVSHIVEAHGGEVILESELGKGTEVTIQLPIDRKILKGG